MSRAIGDFLIRLSRGQPAKVELDGAVQHFSSGDRGGLGIGREPGQEADAPELRATIRAWVEGRGFDPRARRGRYAFVFWDSREGELVAYTDAFRTFPIYYRTTSNEVVCASELRRILRATPEAWRIDREAIYHYLNFAYVPAPRSAVEGVAKLEPGYRLVARPGRAETHREWDAEYPQDIRAPEDQAAADLKREIVDTVRAYRPGNATPWGTFLSGGNDSSSIAGILATTPGAPPVDTYSIGFAEAGYDEITYARLAAKHFGFRAHERFVSEADTVAVIDKLADAFDEPFGNSSAIPTFYCAELARQDGKDLLLAGDGGDEIFGGNERYAKDQVFRWYYGAPRAIRAAGSVLERGLEAIDTHTTNRVAKMLRRGALPNPDRFYTDDSFASEHFDELLRPEWRGAVRRDVSLELQREVFARANGADEIHRLMYLDLKLTIAESDLVKVLRVAKVAGIDVAFPYIDRSLVDYTGRLPGRFKVNGLEKRYLFKRAMADVLPPAIRKKKKGGFGLPVSVWLRREGPLRDYVNDIVLSDRSLQRGHFDAAFVRKLIDRHRRGLWDYSSEIFRLLMLELWQRRNLDSQGQDRQGGEVVFRTAPASQAPMPDKRRSVLMVLESKYPAHGGGGAESQVTTLSKSLKEYGVRTRIVVPRVPGGPQALRENFEGLDVVRIPYPRVRFIGGLVMLVKLAAYLVRHRHEYSVIHAHIAHNMAGVCAIVGRFLGKPVAVKITGPHEMEGGILDKNVGPVTRLRRSAIKHATMMHAISGRIRDVLVAFGFDPARVAWVPNGVDTNRFTRRARDAELRRRLCGDARLVGVYAARLAPQKDHALLFHAWADGLAKAGDVKLLLVGDGILRAELGELAQKLGIGDQVVFAGHADDVAPYLAIADFALLTSTGEGLSNSLLEYMAMGLPVVGSRVSGTEDYVVTGETGWLFESGDRAALAQALKSLGAASDADLRRIGEQAHDRIMRTASVDTVTREWIRRYGFGT